MCSTYIGDISKYVLIYIFINILNNIVEDIQYSSFRVYRGGKKITVGIQE